MGASLQKLMEVVTQAYKTLSDEKARAVYDKALADSEDASGCIAAGRKRRRRSRTA